MMQHSINITIILVSFLSVEHNWQVLRLNYGLLYRQKIKREINVNAVQSRYWSLHSWCPTKNSSKIAQVEPTQARTPGSSAAAQIWMEKGNAWSSLAIRNISPLSCPHCHFLKVFTWWYFAIVDRCEQLKPISFHFTFKLWKKEMLRHAKTNKTTPSRNSQTGW